MNHRDSYGPLAAGAYSRRGQETISLGSALGCALIFGGFFFFLQAPLRRAQTLEQVGARIQEFVLLHPFLSLGWVVAICFDGCWVSAWLQRSFGLKRQGSKLAKLTQTGRQPSSSRGAWLLGGLVSGVALWQAAVLRIADWDCVFQNTPLVRQEAWLRLVLLSVAGSGLALWLQHSFFALVHAPLLRRSLPALPCHPNEIVLGALHEDSVCLSPQWQTMGLKSLSGNLLIAGVIGSGKTQILLQYLKQILTQFHPRPALLAIDPKRTFVRDLKRVIEGLGLQDRLLWVSLEGRAVRFNPLWRSDLLKNSAFLTVAHTLKLASANFLGSSAESRFWEQASFNLLKCSLVYCAASFPYFTFKELYQTLVLAREGSLAAALVDRLKEERWDAEERANIAMAIGYFQDEFSQMDQKIRTSILATATGFLSEFLEFRISQVLSPKQTEITLVSIEEAIEQGQWICLHIENDALARSVGVLFKLMYQEALLQRVNHPDHAQARYAVLVMDEFQDVVTSGGGVGLGDDRFLAKARESKAITFAATQSVSSLENALRSEAATRELLQNFRSRLFLNSTDPRTIQLFQEPHGRQEKVRQSHSFSENSQDATFDLLLGGFGSDHSSLSESISTQSSQEYLVTGREFSRLKAFEAYAQIFDGLETHFVQLFLKPYFLKTMRTSHRLVLQALTGESKRPVQASGRWPRGFGWSSLRLWSFLLCFPLALQAAWMSPNLCSVIRSEPFDSCLSLKTGAVGSCMLWLPLPRPGVEVSYYVPQTFIEVWPKKQKSFFAGLPLAGLQLTLADVMTPGSGKPEEKFSFGVEDDHSTYAFQARAIAIPGSTALMSLPCKNQGVRLEKGAFDLMSEHLGDHWNKGSGDNYRLSPWQLLSLVPGGIKTCLDAGSAQGLAAALGSSFPVPLGNDMGGVSNPALALLPLFPPSTHLPCNGWGAFFPRHGVYDGGSGIIAALMIASRLKSLASEVAFSLPAAIDEFWQMIYPQPSSCFREGANPGVLENLKGLREERRLAKSFTESSASYLFVIWQKVSCCEDLPEVVATPLIKEALKAVCNLPGIGDLP